MKTVVHESEGSRWGERAGSVLALVLVVVLAVSTVGLALLRVGAHDSEESTRRMQSARALWLAEAGIQNVKSLLRVDEDYRDHPDDVAATVGRGAYGAGVEKADDLYTVTSTGEVVNADRVLRQDLLVTFWPAAFDYALFGDSGDLDLKAWIHISGSVFQRGNVNLNHDVSISEYLYSAGGITAHDTAQYDAGVLAAEPPMPEVDFSYYRDLLDTAETSGTSGNQRYDNLDLDGLTLYIDGDFTLNNSGALYGGGKVVATGNITLSQGASVGDDIMLIAGDDAVFNQGNTVGSNCVVYAEDVIELRNGTITLTGVALLTPGDVTGHAKVDLTGVIYAQGSVDMKNDISVVGAVVAGHIEGAKAKLDIVYDREAFPVDMPPGINDAGEARVLELNWREI